MAEVAKKKRRRLKKDKIGFVVQLHGPEPGAAARLEDLLQEVYVQHVAVNRHIRPDDELDIKDRRLLVAVVKDEPDELRLRADLALEHYTVVRYDYAGLREQLSRQLALGTAGLQVTPASDPAYAALLRWDPDAAAAEDIRAFLEPAPSAPQPPLAAPRGGAPAPVPRRSAAAKPAPAVEQPFAQLMEAAKIGAAGLFGLLLGVRMARGSAPAAEAPQPAWGGKPLNL